MATIFSFANGGCHSLQSMPFVRYIYSTKIWTTLNRVVDAVVVLEWLRSRFITILLSLFYLVLVFFFYRVSSFRENLRHKRWAYQYRSFLLILERCKRHDGHVGEIKGDLKCKPTWTLWRQIKTSTLYSFVLGSLTIWRLCFQTLRALFKIF